MRGWILGKLVLVCDAVSQGMIDHNPLDTKSGEVLNESNGMVCTFQFLARSTSNSLQVRSSLTHHEHEPALRALVPPMINWPVKASARGISPGEHRFYTGASILDAG
jgi:hypothetical protein